MSQMQSGGSTAKSLCNINFNHYSIKIVEYMPTSYAERMSILGPVCEEQMVYSLEFGFVLL